MNKSEENAWRESLYTKEANDQYRASLEFLLDISVSVT